MCISTKDNIENLFPIVRVPGANYFTLTSLCAKFIVPEYGPTHPDNRKERMEFRMPKIKGMWSLGVQGFHRRNVSREFHLIKCPKLILCEAYQIYHALSHFKESEDG